AALLRLAGGTPPVRALRGARRRGGHRELLPPLSRRHGRGVRQLPRCAGPGQPGRLAARDLARQRRRRDGGIRAGPTLRVELAGEPLRRRGGRGAGARPLRPLRGVGAGAQPVRPRRARHRRAARGRAARAGVPGSGGDRRRVGHLVRRPRLPRLPAGLRLGGAPARDDRGGPLGRGGRGGAGADRGGRLDRAPPPPRV
ncbi:MAG: hypothetical protein AVDCRST_MAG40-253, partial [uncultured Gemmatimonadaceae bacterium]